MALGKNPPPPPPRLEGNDAEADQRSIQKWYSQLHNNLLNETRLGDPTYQYAVLDWDAASLPDPEESSLATAQDVANRAYQIASDGDGGAALAAAAAAQASADLSLKIAQNLADVADAIVALANLGGAPLASPTFTGTPAAPTAAADTNTTQLATTAFVIGQAGANNPVINGTAAPGTSKKYSREDHVHPTDTTRAPLASPALTGSPTVNGNAILTDAGAWTSFTPTITPSSGTFTSVTASGVYQQRGKTVHFRMKLTVTTQGTASTTSVDLSLPVTAATTGFVFIGRENAVTGDFFIARTNSTTVLRIQGQASSPSTYPVGNGYVLDVSGTYEAA